MLTRQAILANIELGNIIIEPFDARCVGVNSVDLHLSDELKIYGDEEELHSLLYPETFFDDDGIELVRVADKQYSRVLDMKKDNSTVSFRIPGDGLILLPGQLYLGSTVEFTETRGFIPNIETRSSVARLGIATHLSAGAGETTFRGCWTLEIVAYEPVRIYAGVRVCSISYTRADGKTEDYKGKYQGQRGPQASRLFKDFLP